MNTGRTHFKKGCIPWNKNLKGYNKDYPRSKAWGDKISLGKKNSLKSTLASKKAGKEMGNNRLGSKHSEKTKEKQHKAHKGKHTGSKSNWWKGGITDSHYSVDWTEDLRRAIRKRDKYTCFICGTEPAVHVHHIDYDKQNCNLDNLITLCIKCHPKTNHNRKDWIKYFDE